ncbi:hypothetical protein ACFX1Q_044712 [Malus domestica]
MAVLSRLQAVASQITRCGLGNWSAEPTDRRRLSCSTTTTITTTVRTKRRNGGRRVGIGCWARTGGSREEVCSGCRSETEARRSTFTPRGSRSCWKFRTFLWDPSSARSSTLALLSTRRLNSPFEI